MTRNFLFYWILSILAVLTWAPIASTANTLPKITIIATGGTIAGVAQSGTAAEYQASQLPVAKLLEAVPEIQNIAQVSGKQAFQISSQDMSNQHWLALAKQVNQLLASEEVDGIVITHGTDTMEETAYFLNLVTQSKKPVVLTGAMRASTSLSADGPLNLYNAVSVAANLNAVGKGVLVVLNDRIHSARDVTKTNTSSVGTFEAANFGALGYVYYGSVRFYRESTRKHTYQSEFNIDALEKFPQVDIIYGHQHNSTRYIDAAIAGKVDGIISAGVGNGNQHENTLSAMIKARQQGIQVVRSSRVGSGSVTLGAEVDDEKYDFVVADNLNPQKSRILLMLALTKYSDSAEIQRLFFEY